MFSSNQEPRFAPEDHPPPFAAVAASADALEAEAPKWHVHMSAFRAHLTGYPVVHALTRRRCETALKRLLTEVNHDKWWEAFDKALSCLNLSSDEMLKMPAISIDGGRPYGIWECLMLGDEERQGILLLVVETLGIEALSLSPEDAAEQFGNSLFEERFGHAEFIWDCIPSRVDRIALVERILPIKEHWCREDLLSLAQFIEMVPRDLLNAALVAGDGSTFVEIVQWLLEYNDDHDLYEDVKAILNSCLASAYSEVRVHLKEVITLLESQVSNIQARRDITKALASARSCYLMPPPNRLTTSSGASREARELQELPVIRTTRWFEREERRRRRELINRMYDPTGAKRAASRARRLAVLEEANRRLRESQSHALTDETTPFEFMDSAFQSPARRNLFGVRGGAAGSPHALFSGALSVAVDQVVATSTTRVNVPSADERVLSNSSRFTDAAMTLASLGDPDEPMGEPYHKPRSFDFP